MPTRHFRLSFLTSSLALPTLGVGLFGLPFALGPAPDAGAIVVRDDVPLKTVNNRSNRPRYQSIGRLDTAAPFLSGSLRGTGTLVAPDWVLTAAHVLDGTSTTRFTVGGESYNIAGWTAPTGYQNDPSFYTDIALVKLDRPVVGVTPAQLRRSSQTEVGRTAMILGYGYAGHGSTGQNHRTAQTLRLSTNRIDAVDAGHILRTDFSIPGASAAFELYDTGSEVTRFEGALTAGDSGAPAFMYDGTGFTLGAIGVYAVDHRGGALDGNYLEENGLLRVTPHLNWIDSVINGGLPDAALFASNTQTVQEDLDKLLADSPDTEVVGWTGNTPTGVTDTSIFPTGATLNIDSGATLDLDFPTGGLTVTNRPGPPVVLPENYFQTAEQGDLDIMLTNWGNGAFTGTEENLVGGTFDDGYPTAGQVGQDDLDAVLQNWGETDTTAGELVGDRVVIGGEEDTIGQPVVLSVLMDGSRLAGDLNFDGRVDQDDFDKLLQSWGSANNLPPVGLEWTDEMQAQLDAITRNWGSVLADVSDPVLGPMPEPVAAIALLPLVVLRRRRAL